MKHQVAGWVALGALAVASGSCAHGDEPASQPRRTRPRFTAEVPAGPPSVEAPPPAAALLEPGTPAPDIAAPDQDGKLVRLKDLRGRHVVLYFFLQDFNPACTLQSRKFRENQEKFDKLDATVVGVSADKVIIQKEFAEKEALTFPLLSDPDDKIARAFGVPVQELEARRITFVIDREGIVRNVFNRVRPVGHAAEVLAVLDAAHQGELTAAATKKAEAEAAAKKAAAEAATKKAADAVAAKKAAVEEAKAAKKAKAEEAIAAKKAKAEAAVAAKEAKRKGKGKEVVAAEKSDKTAGAQPAAAAAEKSDDKAKDKGDAEDKAKAGDEAPSEPAKAKAPAEPAAKAPAEPAAKEKPATAPAKKDEELF